MILIVSVGWGETALLFLYNDTWDSPGGHWLRF